MKALFQALKLVPAQSLKSISRLDPAAASSLNVTSKVWPLLLVKAQRSADGSVDEKCRALFKEKGPLIISLSWKIGVKVFARMGKNNFGLSTYKPSLLLKFCVFLDLHQK